MEQHTDGRKGRVPRCLALGGPWCLCSGPCHRVEETETVSQVVSSRGVVERVLDLKSEDWV